MRAGLLALALAACAAPANPPAPALDLAGTHWMRVDRLDNSPHFPTLDFTADAASGHAGCNRWHGQVEREGERLRFSAVGATRMMCPGSAMATERSLLDALSRTRSARIEGEQLVLIGEGGEAIASFDPS